jgi:hypothetical protein
MRQYRARSKHQLSTASEQKQDVQAVFGCIEPRPYACELYVLSVFNQVAM